MRTVIAVSWESSIPDKEFLSRWAKLSYAATVKHAGSKWLGRSTRACWFLIITYLATSCLCLHMVLYLVLNPLWWNEVISARLLIVHRFPWYSLSVTGFFLSHYDVVVYNLEIWLNFSNNSRARTNYKWIWSKQKITTGEIKSLFTVNTTRKITHKNYWILSFASKLVDCLPMFFTFH